ncbi:sensor histidine kinase [Spirosoma sp. KUDC1026]|uniref:sensor histidine kinase n=1 Tax=Spirosoma sp. KUDC1026 TaxID=2745947 RepID=UPI00159BD9BC|nr:sensor histidine kinase [Spirosoma sp. KUDC1026]QKZ14716.1 sensor histidine kinase [Spirosoma sp. KUDC1026]
MTIRFVPGCYLLFCWVIMIAGGQAQSLDRLKLQPGRLEYAQEVERTARKNNDTLQLAEACYLYGKTYAFAGDYRASQGYFLKSLQLLEPRGDSNELSRLYIRLSENEGRMGHLRKATEYARQALITANRVGKPKTLARTYGGMAQMYSFRWDGAKNAVADSILFFYRQEERLYRQLNDTLGIAETSLKLGTYFTRLGSPQAITYLNQSLQQFKLAHKDRMIANTLLHLAEGYLRFGQAPLAYQTLRQAEKVYAANNVDEIDIRMGFEQQYMNYYRATGQWEKAFTHLENYNRLERRQLTSDYDGTVARMNVVYETQKKEAQLAAQQIELERFKAERLSTVLISLLLLLAIGASIVLFRLYRINKRTSLHNAELVREQNHRVKNNLQVVSSLLSMQARRLTNEVARKAVEESRLRIDSMAVVHRRLYEGDKLVAVDLKEFIQDLTDGVLKTFDCGHVRVELNIDTNFLSADKATPLGLILNELITNACKYAFPGQEQPMLRIDCHQKQDQIELQLMDNGPGLDESLPVVVVEGQPGRSPKSFGMLLIRSLVTQLKGTCQFSAAWAVTPVASSVEASSEAGPGTLFTLSFRASDD